MKKSIFIVLFLLITMSYFLKPAEIKFKGLVQPWFYYAEQDSTDDNTYGFTLRRVRFKPYGFFSKSIQWVLQFAWDKQEAKLIDAYLDFLISKSFHLRVGQYTVPGTISSSLTSSGKLDLIERPEITQKWSENSGLSGYRAVGIQIHGTILKDQLYYAFMVSNPKTYGVFTPSLKSSEYINENNGISFWGRIELNILEGLRFGAFFGTTEENNNEIKRSSYGAHLFYVKNKLNLKLEYISGQYSKSGEEKKYSGMYAVFGYKIEKFEPIIGYGLYSPFKGAVDEFGVIKYKNFSLGINYFHNKNIKIQANYIIRDESMVAGIDEIKNNIFYINFQYSF